MKEYVLVEYELNNIKGHVIIDSKITDDTEIKDICVKDYLELCLRKNVKIIKKEKKEGI